MALAGTEYFGVPSAFWGVFPFVGLASSGFFWLGFPSLLPGTYQSCQHPTSTIPEIERISHNPVTPDLMKPKLPKLINHTLQQRTDRRLGNIQDAYAKALESVEDLHHQLVVLDHPDMDNSRDALKILGRFSFFIKNP